MELLHLMIAAESLLLDREAEKRLRLATLLPRLVNIDGKTNQDIFSSINDIYSWRSDYVHSGEDVFPEYDEDFKDGEIQKKIYLVRRVIGQVLVDAPKWLSMSETFSRSRRGWRKE